MKNPKILLTGFEPFGELKVNPTEKIVKSIELEVKTQNIEDIETYVLPVTEEASEIVNSLLLKNYDYVVHLGLHGKTEDIAIERVGINIDDYRIPDNKGITIHDKPIDPEGKNAYFVDLPVRNIEKSLLENGIPCHISYSAGTYLCNHLLYTTLNFIEKNDLNTKAGFIHIPNFDKMEFERMMDGIKLIIKVLGIKF